jgi:hypothetical protein
MTLSLFFRHPSPLFHSIEAQFEAVMKAFPKELIVKPVIAKYPSKGLLNRLLITLQATFNQGDINQITGDIRVIALFLKRQ